MQVPNIYVTKIKLIEMLLKKYAILKFKQVKKKYSFLTLAQPAIKRIKMNSVELSLDSESFHFSVLTERDRKRERTES